MWGDGSVVSSECRESSRTDSYFYGLVRSYDCIDC